MSSGRGKWELYRGNDKEWRWQHKSPEGEIDKQSKASFPHYLDCVKDAWLNGMSLENDEPETLS